MVNFLGVDVIIPGWLRYVIFLIRLDGSQLVFKINLSRLVNLCLMHKFPSDIKNREQSDGSVSTHVSQLVSTLVMIRLTRRESWAHPTCQAKTPYIHQQRP